MPTNRDEIKAICAMPMTGTAKLVAIAIVTFKTLDTNELAAITGESARTVQKARATYLELKDEPREPEFAKDAKDANYNSSLAPASHARIETPSGLLSPEEVKQDPPLVPQGQAEAKKVLLQDESLIEAQKAYAGVTMTGGVIALHNGTRQFWLDRFGGDGERLSLALIQAAAYVQPNSNRPLETQVGAQLARIAGEKREKDQRYAKAAATKPTTPAGKPRSAAEGTIARGKDFMALLGPSQEAVA